MTSKPAGRTLDINLHLLDRQVVGQDRRMVCKVDDLEFERGADGALYIAKILVGPRARARRTPGRLGRWIYSVADRLSTAEIASIDMALVQDIDSAVTVSATVDELDVNPLEDWVREYVIARIPGSRHAGE
jgi:hypothetical protein